MAASCGEGWGIANSNGWWSGGLRKGVGGGSRRFENFRRGPRRGKMVRGILWRRERKAAMVARKVGMRPLLEARERSRSRES